MPAGDVCVWMRKSSKASGWLPEGPGFKIFETAPVVPPPIAKTHAPASWGQAAIQATIRAWYGYMSVDQNQLKDVRTEWEKRFAALPHSEDASEIDALLRLQWRELPKRNVPGSAGAGGGNCSETFTLDAVTARLENPPVNPLVGMGRTAADVARDTMAWRQYVRGDHATGVEPSAPTPVFQSDYLLILLPGQMLQLHRVASGLFIYDAQAPNINFQTTEYKQISHAVGGFWGEFTMKMNDAYNPTNKKTGGLYVRHNEISRAHVRVYNVAVVALKKPPPPPGERPATYVRIHLASLVALSKLHPEFPIPDPLPDSHADDEVDDPIDEADELEEEEDDPPPPIPQGFGAVPSESLTSLEHFMLWSKTGRQVAAWHVGVVTKTYPPGYVYRRHPYTHDAKLDGKPEVRGVNLTADLETDGYWVALQKI